VMFTMIRMRRRLVVVAALLALAGCDTVRSWLGIDDQEYKSKAPKPVKLEVPPDLAPQPKDDRFSVPERGQATASATAAAAAASNGSIAPAAVATAAASPAPVATAGSVAPTSAAAHIERDGAQRWLAVALAPEATYAGVKEFFAAADMTIAREDPQLGLIETDWSERRAKDPESNKGIFGGTFGLMLQHLTSTGLRDRYRVRIERAANGQSLVFVSHRGLEEVYTSRQKDSTTWEPAPPAPELEEEMLQRLLIKFGGVAAPAPMQANAAATPKPAAAPAAAPAAVPSIGHLVKGDGGLITAISLDQPFDRAWRQVGLALDRGGFTVEDRDRAKGLFFVRYIDPDYEQGVKDKQSWYARLFGSDPKLTAQQFRIAVAGAGDVSSVMVQDANGETDRTPTAERILKLVNDQLR